MARSMVGLGTGEQNKNASDEGGAGGRTGSPSKSTDAAPRSGKLVNPDVWFCEMDQVGRGSEFMENGRSQPVVPFPSELPECLSLNATGTGVDGRGRL